MRHEAEPELIARARHDRAAFAALYDLYVGRVYAFCAIHSATREEAEDLTAQTFVHALAAIGRYEERGQPFSAWLLRIAANAAANHARHPVLPLSDGNARAHDVAATTAANWVTEWEQAEWIDAHVATLPDDQQRVIQLRFYEDHSFGHVAEAMGRSEGAVKQLVRRALAALRRSIDQEARRDEQT